MMMKTIGLTGCLMLAFGAWAVEPSVNGTVYTYAVADDITETIAGVPSGATKLVKTGAGELVISAASGNMADGVYVEEGKVTITDENAIGANSPIIVSAGATFEFKAALSNTGVFRGHALTIAGAGVDGTGAFKCLYTSGSADTIIQRLTLSDDATIDVSHQWGLVNGAINLNGKTLTVLGNKKFCLQNVKIQNLGYIDFPRLTTGRRSSLRLWGGSSYAYEATTPELAASTGAVRIVFGELIFDGGNPSKVYFPLEFSGSTSYIQGQNNLTYTNEFHGPVTVENIQLGFKYGNVRFFGPLRQKNGGAVLNIPNGAAWSGTSVYLANGSFCEEGSTALATLFPLSGRLVLEGTEKHVGTVKMSGFDIAVSSILQVDSDFSVGGLALASEKTNELATLHQTGGRLQALNTFESKLGAVDQSCGNYYLEGGSAVLSNHFKVACGTGSFGTFVQKDGYFSLAAGQLLLAYLGTGNQALLYQSGGTNNCSASRVSGLTGGLKMGAAGNAVLTLTGGNTLLNSDWFHMGDDNAASTNVLNISEGATLAAGRLIRGLHEGSVATFNANGGTYKFTYHSAWNNKDQSNTNSWKSSPKVVLHEKGLTVDVSDERTLQNGCAISAEIVDASGGGISSITLPTDNAEFNDAYENVYKQFSYRGPVMLEIEGDGFGASAFVDFDFATRKLSNVVITSPGCGYTKENTKVYIRQSHMQTRYACDFEVAPNTAPGPLRVVGNGTRGKLLLFGIEGKWTGGTIAERGATLEESWHVNSGLFDALPQDAPYTVRTGGKIHFLGSQRITTLTGSDGTISGSDITVKDKLSMTCAEAFSGKPIVVTEDLTFGENAVFEIADVENLDNDAYKNAPASVVIQSSKTLTGMPRFAGGEGVSGKWYLAKKGNTLTFGFVKGTIVILR